MLFSSSNCLLPFSKSDGYISRSNNVTSCVPSESGADGVENTSICRETKTNRSNNHVFTPSEQVRSFQLTKSH